MRCAFALLDGVLGFIGRIALLLLIGSIVGRSPNADISALWLLLPVICAIATVVLLRHVTGRRYGAALSGMVCSGIVMYAGACWIGWLPSDASMIRSFQDKKPILEKLAAMPGPMNYDNPASISLEYVTSDLPPNAKPCIYPNCDAEERPDFPAGEATSAQQMLMSANLTQMAWVTNGKSIEIEFPVASEAVPRFLDGSAEKGYVFSVARPTGLAKNLDRFNGHVGDNNLVAYRHITGNWYLYYEYDPQIWP